MVHPRGHEAGHAEVKVPISPEPGPLSHLFLQNCGKSAGQRHTNRPVVRAAILFQNLMRLLDSVTKRDLNAELVSAALRAVPLGAGMVRASENVLRQFPRSA